ncbi:MAG: hypothetical protein WA086_15860, partial [Ideonella sp.]
TELAAKTLQDSNAEAARTLATQMVKQTFDAAGETLKKASSMPVAAPAPSKPKPSTRRAAATAPQSASPAAAAKSAKSAKPAASASKAVPAGARKTPTKAARSTRAKGT